jgi:hypothetical protein
MKALKFTLLVQVALLAAQTISAGLLLSGHAMFVAIHEWGGRLAVLSAAALFLLVLRSRAQGQATDALIWISASLAIAEVLEIALGYRRILSIHVPLGVAIVVFAGRLINWAWSGAAGNFGEGRWTQSQITSKQFENSTKSV